MSVTSLFIGRFQPLHKGHLAVIKKLVKLGKLKIGIGSAQYKNTRDNPLSVRERQTVIERLLASEKITAELFEIEDVHDDEKWVAHVCTIVGKFDAVYSGNDWVIRLFKEKDFSVKVIKEIEPYKSTKIREAICSGKSITRDVPAIVLAYLDEINAIERIKRIGF